MLSSMDDMRMSHHPAEPQAGLTGCAQSDICRGDVWGGLQGLDLPGGLAGGTGAYDIHLPHPEPEIRKKSTDQEINRTKLRF